MKERFALDHHGDEVIITSDSAGLVLFIKKQTGVNEFRSLIIRAETQTQLERLLPSILKALS